MLRKLMCILTLFVSSFILAQDLSLDELERRDSIRVYDLKYREDQFYAAITHSMLQEKPAGFSPRTFSQGLHLGFLRDFPVNKKRTLAVAPGVGYSYFILHNNLVALNDRPGEFAILGSYKRNAQHLHYFDIPIELRWRTSTPESHKFWRVYLGFKASYLISNKLKTSSEDYGTYTLNDNSVFNKWTYSMYLSAGFNTWNVYLSYGLNSIYKQNLFENDTNKLRYFNAGLIFYIL